jgi:hypothetical protein
MMHVPLIVGFQSDWMGLQRPKMKPILINVTMMNMEMQTIKTHLQTLSTPMRIRRRQSDTLTRIMHQKERQT